MYVAESISNGLKILCFDKEVIKKVAREKNLEEIFLSTLFINYLISLVVFIITLLIGGIKISGKSLNLPVFYSLLMVYPFVFNIIVYSLYAFFGLMAELLNRKKHIKPLISVGFHTGIVYSLVVYIILLISLLNYNYGKFLFSLFGIYFLLIMFLSIKEIYRFSTEQTIIMLLVPILLIFVTILIILPFIDLRTILAYLLA